MYCRAIVLAGESLMRWYEPAGIGITIGVIYGLLLWFIKSQVVLIYSQGIAFHTYYDPNMVAFSGAALSSILCLLLVISYQSIYEVFETIALKLKKEQGDDDK